MPGTSIGPEVLPISDLRHVSVKFSVRTGDEVSLRAGEDGSWKTPQACLQWSLQTGL